jgi:hypothetical protein
MGFDPCNHSLKIRDSNSQNWSSLGSVRVHSLTLSYTPGSIRCDSWASLLACTLTSPCLSGEPKAKIAATNPWICVPMFFYNIMSVYRWRMFAISINMRICYYCMPMLHTNICFLLGQSFNTNFISSVTFNNNLPWSVFHLSMVEGALLGSK